MSENQQAQSQAASSDPLASLHRMSTTAGVAAQEYVAINLTAVVTLVLGIASILVFLSATLLVVPVVAIIIGIVALRQIGDSNGTQTGKGIAWLGMILGVGMAAMIGVREVRADLANRAEQAAVTDVVAQLGNAIVSEKYDKAWGLCGEQFQKRPDMSLKVFTDRWHELTSNPMFGKITAIRTNGRVSVSPTPQPDGTQPGVSMLIITFEKSDRTFRREIYFNKQDGQWKIVSIPALFPPPQENPGVPPAPLPGQSMPQ